MNEHAPRYDIVSPLGHRAQASAALSPGLSDLGGRKIAFIWNYLFRGDEAFTLARQHLTRAYPSVQFVDYEIFGNVEDNAELLEQIPGRLQELEVDGAFIATGG